MLLDFFRTMVSLCWRWGMFFGGCVGVVMVALSSVHCGNPNPPGGGPKDSIPPFLMGASLPNLSTNVKSKTIIFYFTENIVVKDPRTIIVNPHIPDNKPEIYTDQNRLYFSWNKPLKRAVTYSINIGKNVYDLNESNPMVSPIYFSFSTGRRIDSNIIYGRVLDSKTGKADPTMLVTLFENMEDSAVFNESPTYLVKVDSSGVFSFWNVKDGTYKIYAMKDESGSGRYVSASQLFAYQEEALEAKGNQPMQVPTLYAFAKEAPRSKQGKAKDSLVFVSLIANQVAVYDSIAFEISPVPDSLNKAKIHLMVDSIPAARLMIRERIEPDSSKIQVTVGYPIPLKESTFALYFDTAFAIKKGVSIARIDTLRFSSAKPEKYGSLHIEHDFKNENGNYFILNLRDKSTQKIVHSLPLNSPVIEMPHLLEGEYTADVLNDKNQNRQWDPGSFFGKKIQAEVSIALKKPVAIRADEQTTYIVTLDEKEDKEATEEEEEEYK